MKIYSFLIGLAAFSIVATPAESHAKTVTIGGGAPEGGYSAITNKLLTSSSMLQKQKRKTKLRSTGGSLTNIKAIKHGEFTVGIAQADIAEAAFKGIGVFKSQGQFTELRTIARLYPEYIHLIVRANSSIKKIEDLRGKHIGLGAAGSGTLEDSIKVLKAYGLKELDVKGHYSNIKKTIRGFKKNEIDAFFFVTADPSLVLRNLSVQIPIRLLSIGGNERERLLAENHTLTRAALEGGQYGTKGTVETVSVSAQLLVSANEDENYVYNLTKSLWEIPPVSDGTIPVLDYTLALNNLAAPLHPGAEKYYRERKNAKF